MAIFPTIEVQGNAELGADNRKIWFGEKMDEILIDINNQRIRDGKTPVGLGAQLKNGIVNSANLRNLFRNDFNRIEPQIVGTELDGFPYQLEVALVGNSYTRLVRYAGKYTLDLNGKKNNRHFWVKQSGGHAIWYSGRQGWRIGSIREKDRNVDNTAFKSNGNGNHPMNGGQWEHRLRDNLYRNANGILRRLNDVAPKMQRDLLFDDRRSLQLHVANFRNAFQGLITGRDKLVTCIQAYNAYSRRPRGYNCGNEITTLARPCGGNGATEGGIIAINNLAWFAQQLTNGRNGVQPIVKNWISENTPGGQPNVRSKVELTTTGSHLGNAGGSLNTMDRRRVGTDLKAHFYLRGIPA